MSVLERLSSHQTASGSGLLRHQQRPALPSVCGTALPRVQQHRRRVIRSNSSSSSEIPISSNASFPAEAATQQRTEDHTSDVKTRYIAETLLPTRHGKFRLRGYKHSLDGGRTFTEPTAVIAGQVEGKSEVPLRVHDACFTSEVLGSLKCDCAEQLELALEYIQNANCGLVIYLQQEGRGIGLANKIAAYALQEQGLDTVDANRALGLPDDCREYTSVRNILHDLKVESVQVMTNNPRKLDVLTQLGVKITGRIPCQVQAGLYNQGYLTAKRERMDHLLDGSWCYWNHDGEPSQPSSAAKDDLGMGVLPGVRAATKSLKVVPPSLASHTVELDEEEGMVDSSNSSSSVFAVPAVARNGSSSSTSSTSSPGTSSNKQQQ